MEAASEGEDRNQSNDHNNNNSNSKFGNSSEGQSKPKRQMKTPFQLETLEKAYAMETYPSEATRVQLSEKLGLSDRQLQMWFCHRRLKDKKDVPAKRPRKTAAAALPESPVDELRAGEPGSDYGSGSGSGSSPVGRLEFRNVGTRNVVDDVPMVRRYYESPQSVLELRAIACVEAQLGEPLREDGPILGIEFDPLPPDAFGAPIAAVPEQQKRPGHPYEGKLYEQRDAKSYKATARVLREYPFLPDQPGIRSDAFGQVAQSHFHDSMADGPTARTSSFMLGNEQLPRVHGVQGHTSRVRHSSQQDRQGLALSSPPRDDDRLPERESLTNVRINSQFSDHPIIGPEDSCVASDGQIFQNDAILRKERKRKSEDAASVARDVEAHEIRMRKELEKQDILRRKSEERMRKEMEKQDRERRKEEERLMREKQREEERSKREQRREIERREKFLQREYLRAEKRRQKEELRKEKEEVRRKAAIEKATARKIARESMELIEDEQLELMELAAASKGLSSMIHLDHDSLQNIESFRGSLSDFPPKSLKLKKPFAIQPWINSEENIGNLLMVWRFLITFVDVLKLWPFTLDEFVQAFHDYDSRLSGEIHVALLKLIIKDIEDVARTPSTGLGMNQNGAANPGGGHPHIVEGAYAWGFDIRNWQRHLNPLTWPEIFRQLALSAGFGPQLKKRSITWSYLHENDEGKGCEDIISTLRNGSAAENAFVIMQEKGLLLPRRSRHRLTPGTVKFAAFHVLSLEGSKGLTVLELADKIQKSGLRDLTTSKTPEASISVALTRDAKLFERIAPSTYRVRAAYRKDPADAEAILSAARKKIQIFENGFLAEEDVEDVEREDAEDVEREDAEDVERDEDSECDDVDEDPEVDDFATPSIGNKTSIPYSEVKACLESGNQNICNNVALDLQNKLEKDFSSIPLSNSKDENCPSIATAQYVAGEDISANNLDQENMEIDESKSGDSWIQGLTEGEYSDLSVEERLNALVTLIGVANEGNSIRGVLEDRMEAANALKKQMWAEAQLDKSRLKEEIMSKSDFGSSFVGSKAETQPTSTAVGGSQSPLLNVDDQNEASPSTAENQNLLGSQSIQDHLNIMPTERTPVAQDFSTGPDNFLVQQLGYASKRTRSQLKSYIAHRAEEMYVYRSLPLGQDRRRNRYWLFVASASSSDPGSGRIFIELQDGNWRLIDSEEAFDALLMSLDARGIRESHLRLMLQRAETSFKENLGRNMQCANTADRSGIRVKSEADEMNSSPDCPVAFDSPSSTICGLSSDILETSSSFRIELGRNEAEKKAALNRYQDFQKWMWKECFNSLTLCAMKYGKKRCGPLLRVCDFCLIAYSYEESHCLSCHRNFDDNLQLSEHAVQCEGKRKLDSGNFRLLESSLPLGIRLLKALLGFIEVSVPPEALQSYWMEDLRRTWGVKLNMSSTVEDLLQILTLFERVLKRDLLSSNFATTEALLGSCTQSGSAFHDFADPKSVALLPWIPQTTAAVALRLFELDASIIYLKPEKPEPCEEKEVTEFNLPSRYAPLNNVKEVELAELNHFEDMIEKNSAEMKSTRNRYKRGRGGRDQGRGKRSQKKVRVFNSHAGRRNVKSNENLIHGLRQQGQRTYSQGSGRGRRTVRRRRVEKRAVDERLPNHRADSDSPKSIGESPSNVGEDWDDEKISMLHMEGADNINDPEEVESDDNAQAVEYDQGNWEIGFTNASNGWRGGLVEASDEDVDASEDDNGIEEAVDEDSEVEAEMSEGSDGTANRIGNDEGSDSAVSDDYSE
ncbi:homeobox-DDT domain protein RLT1 isoform X2 [Corylus avellana]|uniref:homeobox-DDT domain protein RLT1 isoform X2 n=1 Tax=Corylus avellana TaxID=13451 RepID=UPI00286B1682|nr:homeobox-DDT domain protein RLT1 isoform X2 [Corylus avellana]